MDETLKQQVIEMSEGNPGCINVLMQTYTLVGDLRFGRIADTLQANGITGSLVWVEYKDKHDQDIEAFIRAVEDNLIEPVTNRKGLVAAQKTKGV